MPLKGTLHREKTADDGSKNSQNESGHLDVEEVEYTRVFVWKLS